MRVHKWILPVLSVCLVMSSATALAGISACPSTLSNVEQLTCLQAQNEILETELSVAQKQKSLDKITQTAGPSRTLPLPEVLAVYGVGQKPMTAILGWPNGQSLQVQLGDHLPGGFVVSGVSNATVTVRKGGRTHVLLMDGGSTSAEPQALSHRSGQVTQSQPPISILPNADVPAALATSGRH
ncbi:MAG: hypothetical protein PHX24_02115 [Acidithiobacillus sp.]|nr:hypothetical protein [Acidithiobacillus sp.]